MNNQKNQARTRFLKLFFALALLTAVITQLVTVINMFTGFLGVDTFRVHTITGFTIFGLVIIHVYLFRKTLFFLLGLK